MTPKTIDSLHKHAGRLALIIERLATLHRSVQRANDADVIADACDLAELWTQDFANDCYFFKEMYNRRLGP